MAPSDTGPLPYLNGNTGAREVAEVAEIAEELPDPIVDEPTPGPKENHVNEDLEHALASLRQTRNAARHNAKKTRMAFDSSAAHEAVGERVEQKEGS